MIFLAKKKENYKSDQSHATFNPTEYISAPTQKHGKTKFILFISKHKNKI